MPAAISPVPSLLDPACSLSLDGDWRVSFWPFAEPEADLAAPDHADAAWATVQQPGKVFGADPEAEREPIADWNRVTLTHIDPDDGALLRRRVRVPAHWGGRRLYLRFDAVFPAARFYLNGTLLGEHLSGLTPAQFDVTDLLEPEAVAVVAVRLIRRHRFVQMDMVRHALEFAGLSQPARLFAVAPCHVADYHLLTELAASLDAGRLHGSVTVANTSASAAVGRLLVRVAGRESAQDLELAAGASAALAVDLAVPSPRLWNDEYPQLYPVTIHLEIHGQEPQELSYRTGFRRFELSPKGARLNGNPVKFRGVNHLTFHPDSGMYTPADWLRQNLVLMKRANVNAIRTHFLSPPALADLCDELGIYLLQELPIDWGTDYIHDPAWQPPALDRIEAGVRRDRHHPALMVWSVGNENMPKTAAVAEAGWAHLQRYDALVKRLDPSRPTMFPPPGPANKIDGILELRVGDIADTHYSFAHIKAFLADGAVDNPNSWEADMLHTTRERALKRGWSGTWFSSEYGIFNAMPDLLQHPHCSIITDVPEDALSGKYTVQAFAERLEREWGFMRHEPSCLGGAYFPWLCSGAGSDTSTSHDPRLGPTGNPWGWTRWGEDADWGVVTADLLPKPFFWVMRVLFSPVWFPKRVTWRPGDTAIRCRILNQYNAIDLAACTLRVQQNGGGRYMTMMRRFIDVPVSCPPGAATILEIPLEPGPLKSLENGGFAGVRCSLLEPSGYRPITAEILVVPPSDAAQETDATMTIGPDAIL